MERNVIDADDAVGNGATFNGTADDDLLIGRSVADTEADQGVQNPGEEFFAGGGDDIVDGKGRDSAFLGAGDDIFVVSEQQGDGQFDRSSILDFNADEDRLDVSAFADDIDDVTIAESERDGFGIVDDFVEGVLISTDGAEPVLLQGFEDIDAIDEDNFIFAGDDDAVAEAEDDSDAVADDEEEVAEDDEAEEEVAEDDSDTDDDGDLVEVESVTNNFNTQVFRGSGADELFVTEPDTNQRILAGGGDDTIVVNEVEDNSTSTDVIDTGRGSDTIVLGENASVLTRSDGFDVDNDVFDVSNLEGVNSFDDINFDVIDNEESNNNGEFFFFEAGTASVSIDEELQDDLSEDNFIFADDAVA